MREVFDKYVKKQLVLLYNKQNPDFHDYLHEFYDAAKLLLGEVYCIKADIASSERLLKFFGFFSTPTTGFVVFVEMAGKDDT